MRINCVGLTDVGLKRVSNEDDFYLSNTDTALCIVADGMSGRGFGEVAAALAINTIVSRFKETNANAKNVKQLLSTSIQNANNAVFEFSQSEEGLYGGIGSTLVVGCFLDKGVFLAHIGNCRAYLFRSGDLMPKTEDHSIFNEYLKTEKIEKKDFPFPNLATRVIGLAEKVEIEIFFQQLQPGDIILFCSDGLSDNVDLPTLSNAFNHYKGDLMALCQRLINLANEGGGSDNVTVILAEVEPIQW